MSDAAPSQYAEPYRSLYDACYTDRFKIRAERDRLAERADRATELLRTMPMDVLPVAPYENAWYEWIKDRYDLLAEVDRAE